MGEEIFSENMFSNNQILDGGDESQARRESSGELKNARSDRCIRDLLMVHGRYLIRLS